MDIWTMHRNVEKVAVHRQKIKEHNILEWINKALVFQGNLSTHHIHIEGIVFQITMHSTYAVNF